MCGSDLILTERDMSSAKVTCTQILLPLLGCSLVKFRVQINVSELSFECSNVVHRSSSGHNFWDYTQDEDEVTHIGHGSVVGKVKVSARS